MLQWKETAGDESKEFMAYMRQREKQEKAEEELFTRAPVTKREKYMEKQMKKQLHGYVVPSFYRVYGFSLVVQASPL